MPEKFHERHTVTAKTFIAGDYSNRLASGEIRVYKFHAPPSPDTDADEAFAWYANLLSGDIQVIAQPVSSIVKVGWNAYTVASTRNDGLDDTWQCEDDEEFLVFSKDDAKRGGF